MKKAWYIEDKKRRLLEVANTRSEARKKAKQYKDRGRSIKITKYVDKKHDVPALEFEDLDFSMAVHDDYYRSGSDVDDLFHIAVGIEN